jgi:hypothetical protein
VSYFGMGSSGLDKSGCLVYMVITLRLRRRQLISRQVERLSASWIGLSSIDIFNISHQDII